MSDLPPDLQRLRIIETYLQLQLDAVRERIAALAGPQAPAATAAEESWLVEYRRTPSGFQRSVVHARDCFALGGVRVEDLSRVEAVAALTTGELAACAICTPERELGIGRDAGE